MSQLLMEERSVFLSTLPAAQRERRLALIVLSVSVAVFLFAAPFAKKPLGHVWAFIPIYQSALIVNDLITAILLFGQFGILRSRALLVLASGYLFTTFIATAHMLTFPGLFSPTGLLGAGMQSTAWLYMLWHGGFPLFVIAYALLKDKEGRIRARVSKIIWFSMVAVLMVVVVLTLLATAGKEMLPAIMQGHHYTPIMIFVVSSVWLSALLALAILWQKKPHSVLDMSLMVVMCAWLFDVALASVINAGRFDLGFYVGRIYGLVAASFVLVVLLLENNLLYARLAKAYKNNRQKTIALVAVNKELQAFSYSVSHDLRTPLRAMDYYVNMLKEQYSSVLDTEGKRLLNKVNECSRRMAQLIDDMLTLARLGRQSVNTKQVSLDDLVNQVISELRSDWEGHNVEFIVGKLGFVKADSILLKQAIANLIGNSIKFTRKKDSAVIEIGYKDGNKANDSRIYFIKDNGAGFDMHYAEKLFGVFQRLHHADEYEGTGVGLAIVQRIVHRHGGEVWAESTPGEGATFYFTLPPLVANPAR